MARSQSPFTTVSRRGPLPGKKARYSVVWVGGEQDIATKASLVVTIARAAQRHDGDLLVDLSAVTFMDASTVGAIVGSRNRLLARSQSLEVRAPSKSARRVLELCGLGHLVYLSAPAVVHPAGVAAALSTWVAVPSSVATLEIADDAGEVARAAALQPADAEKSDAAAVELSRGGP